MSSRGSVSRARPNDLTQVLRDQPTEEPSPAVNEPAGGARAPGGRLRGLGRPSPVIGWLLVALAGFGMFVSTPPSAGSDEPAQELTAWYLSEHGLPPASVELFSVPVSFSADACFTKSTITASCAPPRSSDMVLVSTSRVLAYPPPYYWVVGAGQRLTASRSNLKRRLFHTAIFPGSGRCAALLT